MREDKDFLDRLFYLLGRIFASIKTPFGIYLTLIILIVLFPPINHVIKNFATPSSNIISFEGWDFIYYLGSGFEINVIYLLLEIGIITLVYFMYLFSKKK